jgi:DNA-binding transcriptional LysR family regulator
MTLNQLKVFEAVSRYLNITRASAALHVSEPSVFQQVKSLEGACGVKLYRKTGRGIELTREGLLFQTDVREILLRIARLGRKSDFLPSLRRTGLLVVGSTSGPSVSLLPSLAAVFKKSHPFVHVTLRTDRSPVIESLVLKSQVEIGVITNPSNSPLLHVEPYRTEKFVAFASAKHPSSQKKKLTLADFARGPLIVREKAVGSNTWEILAQLERQGYELNVFMECESAEAVKVATMKGLGLGILWRDHLKAEIKRGDITIVKIPNLGKMEAQTFIVYHKERALSSSAQDFLDLLHQSRQRSDRWNNLRKRPIRRGGAGFH